MTLALLDRTRCPDAAPDEEAVDRHAVPEKAPDAAPRRALGREADGLAVASFVLGLVGLLVFNIVLGPTAIVMALLALVRHTRRRGRAFPRPRPGRRRPRRARRPRHRQRHRRLEPGRLTRAPQRPRWPLSPFRIGLRTGASDRAVSRSAAPRTGVLGVPAATGPA